MTNNKLHEIDLVEMNNDHFKFKFQVMKKIYYNEDNLFGIFYGFTTDKLPEYHKVEILNDENVYMITIKGYMQELLQGCEYSICADLVEDKKYGFQYDVKELFSLIPMDSQKQFVFLNAIANNKTVISNLLEVYPNIINDVMNGENIDLDKVKGLGEKTWNKIKQNILMNFSMSDIIVKLKPLGITMNMIKKMLEHMKSPVLLNKVLETNPYLLVSIEGLGFKKVDDLAIKMNPNFIKNENRLLAFCKFYLTQIGEQEGHTWIYKDVLLKEATNNVPETIQHFNDILNSDSLFVKNDKVGLKKYRVIEEKIFNIIKKRTKSANNISFSDEEIEKAIDQAEKEQGFEYSDEQKEAIYNTLQHNFSILTGKAGCVDCDTEYFNGIEWKRISDYTVGDKVLIYNKDKTAKLEIPQRYIKEQCNELYEFETKYGLSQCLSEEHNVLFVTEKRPDYIQSTKILDIKKKQESEGYGFRGKFITTFYMDGDGINYSDDMIRLFVAVIAYGTFDYNNEDVNNSYYYKCRMHLKKERKKKRLKELLSNIKLNFEEKSSSEKGYTDFYFFVPERLKSFPCSWYNCSFNQKKIIAEECALWNGSFYKKNQFFTTNKKDADFIQYVFSSIGYRANISIDDRQNQKYTTEGKEHIRKSIPYIVSWNKRVLVSLCNDKRKDHTKTTINKIAPKDGYKYCFTVSSGMLVLRRNNKIFITGNSGKTSITKAILNAYDNRHLSIVTCALSAMAAKRISEATLYPAKTIHRTLGCVGMNMFSYNEYEKLQTDLLFLDESSMVNMRLFLKLLEATDEHTNILLSGDSRQLPPIGYGNIFSDLCDILPKKYIAELVTPMRQALKSGILCDANLIRDNISPIFQKELNNPKIIHGELQDMQYRFRESREELFNIAINLYMKALETNTVDDVSIIVPRKSGCINSTFKLNQRIQELLLGDEQNQVVIKNPDDPSCDIVFKLGAKVMQTKNDYKRGVFNGDIGYITYMGKDEKGKLCCNVAIKQPNGLVEDKWYKASEMRQLDLAYALTTHKCQGQSIKSVICIIDNSHYTLLDSCMLYTMLTRAKERCCLLAEPQAFIQCIRTSHNKRKTWLSTIPRK